MEKMNLNAIAKAYNLNEAHKAQERAIFLVENEIIPLLVNTARLGRYMCEVRICHPDVYISDVQNELAKRVQCRIVGFGKSFTVYW